MTYILRSSELDINELRKCENIGVITGTSQATRSYHDIYKAELIEFGDDGKPIIFALKTKTIIALLQTPRLVTMQVFRLTRFGSELSPLITEPDVDLKYEAALLGCLRNNGMEVRIQAG